MRLIPIAVCVAFLAIRSLSTFAAEEVEASYFGKTIRSIRYQADLPLDSRRYDTALGFKPGDVLTRSGVKNAIQGLYDTGRFSEIVVDAVPEGSGVALRFDLRFNDYFDTFDIIGDVNLGGRHPWEVMPLPVGERFTAARLEEARQSVLKYMRERGFYLAEVECRISKDEVKRQVATTFLVRPGRLAVIRSIQIQGVPPSEVKVVRSMLGFDDGDPYDRQRFRRRLDKIKSHYLKEGFLAAVPEVFENVEPAGNTVALVINFKNFGKIQVAVEEFKIDKDRLRRLLPILAGEGIEPELLEEGARNIKDHLEERGYPEADVTYEEEVKSGIRRLRYSISAGRRVTIGFVRFKGNRTISEEELLGAIQIQPARFLQRSVYSVPRLDSDVDSLRMLYESRGYLNARIIPLVEPIKGVEKLGITFDVDEGRLAHTRSVTLTGNRALSTDSLISPLRLKPGGPYSPSLAEGDRQALLASYNDAGFLQAKVIHNVGAPDETNSYPVEFHIDEGTQSFVDDIIILGRNRTRPSVVEKRIGLHKDAALSLGKMLQTQQALYNLGVFDLVRVAPQNPESTAAHQNVVVRLQEARRITFRYGLGYQEREKIRGTFEVSHLNILGIGQRADLRVRGSGIEQGALLSFQQPQFRFLPVDSYFSFSARRKKEVSFDATRVNLSYQFGRPLSGHAWALLRYNFRKVRVSNPQIGVELRREDTDRTLSTFSAIYMNDTRDSYLDPEKGFFTSSDLSVTTKLLGTSNYFSLYTQNGYYHRLPSSLLLAASFRFGLAHPFGGDSDLPISERFYAGGAASLRGFDTDFAGPLDPKTKKPIGGNALLIGNLEISVPAMRSAHLVGFYDVGNVFRSLSGIKPADFSHTIGLGLRIKTPLGPLRLDYGFGLNVPTGLKHRHIFLTIGPPF